MPAKKPSRPVTRPRCVTCGRKFVSHRADARHCSGRSRQRANRARHTSTDIDREIELARRHYWDLIRRKAEARSVSVSQVLTGEAQTVVPCDDGTGTADVFVHGEHVGTTRAGRPGWTQWGLEAAGPPFEPPPPGVPPIDGRQHQRGEA
jgi:hypothetical protein